MSENKSLYELVNISSQIKLKLIESAGELTDEISKQLIELEERLPSKCDGYKSIIEDLNHEAELWRKRAAQFLAVAKTFENHSDRLKDSLHGAIVRMEKTELEGNDFKAKLVKGRPKVIIDDETLVPGIYKKIIQETVIEKEAVARDLADGKKIDGAHSENQFHVRFYPRTGR
jgi:hypothetical protein